MRPIGSMAAANAIRFDQEVIIEQGAVMAEEQKPLGILSIIIMVFLALVIFGVIGGTFFPDSFLGQPI